MTLRSVLLFLLALTVAGFTAVFARNWVIAERAAAMATIPDIAPASGPATMVLVAKRELGAGQFVTADDLSWQAWPEEGIVEEYVLEGESEKDTFVGAVVRTGLTAGQPVTKTRIVHPGDRGFLAAVLEPGKRAVSVPVNATSGISGFVFPGDWVDVILTVRVRAQNEEGKGEARYFSETLLNDIRVLAIDQTVENAKGEVSVAKTATLEVTPKQVEKIALALEMGGLSLSLHSLARDGGTSNETAKVGGHAKSDGAEESYTLDVDVYYMRDRLFGFSTKENRKQVHVLRGGEAEVAIF